MSIKDHIINYLQTNGPDWGGKICRAVHELTGSKESIIERRVRELFNENKLDRCYAKVEGVGALCVRYRIKQ